MNLHSGLVLLENVWGYMLDLHSGSVLHEDENSGLAKEAEPLFSSI